MLILFVERFISGYNNENSINESKSLENTLPSDDDMNRIIVLTK